MSDSREEYMRLAIQLSQQGMEQKNGGPFGAVIVKDGKIIGQGSNEVTSTNDPTAHAEVVAIRNACKNLSSFELFGAEIYCSCEPCPMCLSAIYWARISKIYFANTRKDAADIGFDDDFIYHEIPKAIEQRAVPALPLLRAEAQQVFVAWQSMSDKMEY